jgi:hypothetical protein
MAGLIYDVAFPATALNSTTTYVLWVGVAGSNTRTKIRGVEFYGNANSAQSPGLLSFTVFTGVFTSAANGTVITPTVRDEVGGTVETPQATWNINPSTAPTLITSPSFKNLYVNPQIGVIQSFPDPECYSIKGGKNIVIEFVPGYNATYAGTLEIEE